MIRDLDVQVAERVMGLKVVHHAWPQGYPPDSCEPEAMHFMSRAVAESLEPTEDDWSWSYGLGPVYDPYPDDERSMWPPAKWDGWDENRGKTDLLMVSDEEWSAHFGDTEYACHVMPVPKYSSMIHHTWTVVQKMIEDGFSFELREKHGKWTVSFWGTDHLRYARAITAPEAICQAAIKIP